MLLFELLRVQHEQVGRNYLMSRHKRKESIALPRKPGKKKNLSW